jgi:hypothetical protein
LREVEFEICQYLFAHLDASIEKREKVWNMLVTTSLDILTTIDKILRKSLEVLWRVKRSLF